MPVFFARAVLVMEEQLHNVEVGVDMMLKYAALKHFVQFLC